jgi:hypothetical protein
MKKEYYNCKIKNEEDYKLLFNLLVRKNIPLPSSMNSEYSKEYNFIDIFQSSDGLLYVNQRRTKADYNHIEFEEMLEIILSSNNKEILEKRKRIRNKVLDYLNE